MEERQVKARRYYMTDSVAGVPPERVRVTGWATVNGERWCRIRFDGDRVSSLVMHPSRLAFEVAP